MSDTSTTDTSAGRENQPPGIFMKCTIKTIAIKFPSVKNISTESLSTLLKKPAERTVCLLDCRPDEEYTISHLEGAIDAGYPTKSVEELVGKCEELLKAKPGPTIVCYCSVGYRSSDIAQKLSTFYEKSGKPCPDIFNLEGSLFKWAQERRPMVNQNGLATQFVHPYNAVFGKLVDKELRKEM